MTELPGEQPPFEPQGRHRVLSASLLASGTLLIAGLIISGPWSSQESIERQGFDRPERPEETAALTPLSGANPSGTDPSSLAPPAGPSGARSAAQSSPSVDAVELSDLSRLALEALQGRERRFELISQTADELDERSPADAELMEELDRHLEEESFEDAQLEMDLIRAQGSLQMMRAFNEAAGGR